MVHLGSERDLQSGVRIERGVSSELAECCTLADPMPRFRQSTTSWSSLLSRVLDSALQALWKAIKG